jgi:hypothetical protein
MLQCVPRDVMNKSGSVEGLFMEIMAEEEWNCHAFVL